MDLHNYANITDINCLENLQVLVCSGSSCAITDKSIDKIFNIIELNASSNSGIKNINQFYKMQKVVCSYACGINDDDMRNLKKMKSLNAKGNKYVTDVNHMTLLENADFSCECGVSIEVFSSINNLKNLNVSLFNENIKNFDMPKNLKNLTNFKGNRCREL